MMVSTTLLSAVGNLTSGTEGVGDGVGDGVGENLDIEGAFGVEEIPLTGLAHDYLYTSLLPQDSFLSLQVTSSSPLSNVSSSSSFSAVRPSDEAWAVGVGVGIEPAWVGVLVLVLKGLVMAAVIVVSVLGNLLVIVSVARYHKLRVITNYFVVSMALADMLVALMAMVFNASVQLTNTWLFGPLMCDLWNSMDVYFSTVSILHLCCISIDRYTAIVQPLDYPLRMTGNTVSLMLAVAWVSPVFISVLPIFLGWYTTQEQLDLLASTPGLCDFKVNLAYALVSSSMSFWIPGVIMLVMYFRIYREADRQEMMVFRSTVAALLLNKHLHINGMTRGSVKITDDAPSNDPANTNPTFRTPSKPPPPPQQGKKDAAVCPGGGLVCCVHGKSRIPQQVEKESYYPGESLPLPQQTGKDVCCSGGISCLHTHPKQSPQQVGKDICFAAGVCCAHNKVSSRQAGKDVCFTRGVVHSNGLTTTAFDDPSSPPLTESSVVASRMDLPNSDDSTPTPSPGSTPKCRRGGLGMKRRFLGVGVRKSSAGMGPDAIMNVAASGEVKKKQASLHKMKRERKAAKTLGIIVSVFLLCWLPFFSWYLVSALCGDACAVPDTLVTILFWIGYFNSTLNPIIYAYFNRDFRKAFRKTLAHYGLDCSGCRKKCSRLCCCGRGRRRLVRCVGFPGTHDTPSSEVQPRSALSSEYCHIEMTTVDKVARIGVVDH